MPSLDVCSPWGPSINEKYGLIWRGEGSKMAKNWRRHLWMAPMHETIVQGQSTGFLANWHT
jgi:hypothetical protein